MRFFATVRQKCFEKCIENPGPAMTSGEERCLSQCLDRYIDATRAVGIGLQSKQQ